MKKLPPIKTWEHSQEKNPCHLLYADDILLSIKAYKRGLRSAQELLSKYQVSSGQCFNLQKSQLFTGKCSARRARMIKGLLHIPQALLPSTYLGVPIFLGSSRHSHFNLILDSIRSRLAGWKFKCLSFAGRLIMVKHVLSSIPLHISLAIPIPSKTCPQIERLMRNFLWLVSPEKMCSLVNWETVCLPKTEGGLGLRRVKDFNEACMMKLGWSAVSIDSLWAGWFCARYFRRSSI